MAQINRPQKVDNTGKILQAVGTIGGGVAGALIGGPAGAAAGAGLGGQLAGAAGSLASNDAPQSPGIPQPSGGSQDAMARRQQQLSQDNLATLGAAEKGLAQLPEPLRQQYAPAIIQARMLEQRNRGLA